jgi:hypothetical protein
MTDPNEIWKQWYIEEKPIRKELEELGYKSEYVFDIRHKYPNYESAIPIIFLHLQKQYSDRLLEDLATLLGHPSAFSLWPKLYEMYTVASPDLSPKLMMGLARSLSEHGLRSKSQELKSAIITLLQDKTRGESRLLLLDCFRRKRDQESIELIASLAHDPDLKKEISSWKR